MPVSFGNCFLPHSDFSATSFNTPCTRPGSRSAENGSALTLGLLTRAALNNARRNSTRRMCQFVGEGLKYPGKRAASRSPQGIGRDAEQHQGSAKIEILQERRRKSFRRTIAGVCFDNPCARVKNPLLLCCAVVPSSHLTCNLSRAVFACQQLSATTATPQCSPRRSVVPSTTRTCFTPGIALISSRFALTTFPA
jgi:hypothetical protein